MTISQVTVEFTNVRGSGGQLANGSGTFQLTAPWITDQQGTLVPDDPVPFTIINGAGSVPDLFCNDDATTLPLYTAYKVCLVINGQQLPPSYVIVPSSHAGGTIDFTALTFAGSGQSYTPGGASIAAMEAILATYNGVSLAADNTFTGAQTFSGGATFGEGATLADVTFSEPGTVLANLGGFPAAGGTMTGPQSFGHGTTPTEYWVSKGSLASDSNSGDKDAPFATPAAALAALGTNPGTIHLGVGTWTINAADANGNGLTIGAAGVGQHIKGLGSSLTQIDIATNVTFGVAVTGLYSTIEDVYINVNAGVTATYACGVTTAGTTARARLSGVYVNVAGTVTAGFALGPVSAGNDIANVRFDECYANVASGGTGTYGFLFGSGTVGNILIPLCTGCYIDGFQYLIGLNGTGVTWIGGGGTAGTATLADIAIVHPYSETATFIKYRGEDGQQIVTTAPLDTLGNHACPGGLDLIDCVFGAYTGPSANGTVITWHAYGKLSIRGGSCATTGANTNIDLGTSGSHPATPELIADGWTTDVANPYPAANTAWYWVTVRDHQYLNASGHGVPNTSLVYRADAATGSASVPVVVASSPAQPTGTTSTTQVMAGLAVAFTPSSTGNVVVAIEGAIGSETATATCTVAGRYGTGTAPANGVAATGTQFPQGNLNIDPPAGAQPRGYFRAVGTLTGLTVGTAYWADLAFATTSSADQANLDNLVVTILEHA